VLDCSYTVVTLLLHCCDTVVTLLLLCFYTAVTLLLHCCYIIITPLSQDSPSAPMVITAMLLFERPFDIHRLRSLVGGRLCGYCCYTVVTLLQHCYNTVVTLLLHCCHTVVTLLSHCSYTVLTLVQGTGFPAITAEGDAEGRCACVGGGRGLRLGTPCVRGATTV
jgi:hypothetical protein